MAKTDKKNETQNAAQSTGKITPIKKLTVATIYGKVAVKDIPEGGELKLCRIAGFARGVKQGESNYGDWKALEGEFTARNEQTGEIFASAQAFVPGAMGDMLVQSMESALREDAAAQLKFSVDVAVIVSPRDPNKYEYKVRPVIENALAAPALELLQLEG